MTEPATARAPRADAERNRLRILDAASRVFAARGGTATLSDVAREAGVGVATVYRKFSDKEAVLDALFEQKVAALVQAARTATLVTDPGEAARGLLMALMEQRATDRGLEAVLTPPGRGLRFSLVLGEEFIPLVTQVLARAIEAGEIRPGLCAEEVCLLSFMVGKVADITRPEDPGVWRRYAQLLIDGTRAPAAVPLTPQPLSCTDSAAALGRAD